MSHIIVHDQTARARARMGRIVQIAALPPQLDRHDDDHWQLNRATIVRGSYRQQIRPANIELGEIIQYSFADVGEPVPGGIGTSAGAAVPDYSRQQSFVLHIVSSAGNFVAANTQAFPTGFVVTQAMLFNSAGDATRETGIGWNLYAVDEPAPASSTTQPNGTPLFSVVDATGLAWGGGFGMTTGSGKNQPAATGPIGLYINTPGKRLAFVVYDRSGGFNFIYSLLITVAPLIGGGSTIRVTTRTPTTTVVTPTLPPGELEQIYSPAAPSPAPARTAAPAAVVAPAACARAFEFINWGVAYSVAFGSGTPGSAWGAEAQRLLGTLPALCAGEAAQITDEMNRVLRNFGGSLSLIPVQIAPLISFYQIALRPPASRPTTLSIGRVLISISSAQVREISALSGLTDSFIWSLTDQQRVSLAQRWGVL